ASRSWPRTCFGADRMPAYCRAAAKKARVGCLAGTRRLAMPMTTVSGMLAARSSGPVAARSPDAAAPPVQPGCRRSSPAPGALRPSGGRRADILFQQVLLHEQDRGIELVVGIRLLVEPVALVPGDQVPDRHAVFPGHLHDLLRFAHRHDRIILALHDEE